jgi:hypothetical protein
MYNDVYKLEGKEDVKRMYNTIFKANVNVL